MATTSSRHSSKPAVYAALIGNILVALTKTGAALWTGSAAMMSEAVHSAADSANELLLLYGFHRASRRPDRLHPLGYGRELYFWSFIVALLLFALGSGVSLYEGVLHVLAPEPIENPGISYLVLGLSFLFEGASWWFAFRRFRMPRGVGSYIEAFRRSKDPPSYMVLFEDSAALVGILIVAISTTLAVKFEWPIWDGIGSILVGLLLGVISAFLASESKSLLIGEPADPELANSILQIAQASPGVLRANGLLTVQLSPSQVVAAVSVEFDDDKRADDIEQAVISIETAVQAKHPNVAALFIKPQTRSRFREIRERRRGQGRT